MFHQLVLQARELRLLCDDSERGEAPRLPVQAYPSPAPDTVLYHLPVVPTELAKLTEGFPDTFQKLPCVLLHAFPFVSQVN